MAKDMHRALDKAYREVLGYIEDTKSSKEKINFKKKQLRWLKADNVQKPRLPFKKGMVRLEKKKERRLNHIQMRQEMGNFNRKTKK